VAHTEFLELDLASMKNGNSIIYDVKGILNGTVDGKL
jgi:UDP-N-acetyl-D-galactosamine dehydrogenase